MKDEILDAFYNALPDGTTLEDLAEGMIIKFEYKHQNYTVDTKVGSGFRCISMDSIYDEIERKVIDEVLT
jgi:hypothetical protein